MYLGHCRHSCFYLMDKHTPLFRYIISLASLAYTFTVLHTIQYSMRNSVDTTQTPQDYESTNPSTSTHDSFATTSMSENTEKSNNRWTDHEVKQLLDYVAANCTLTTGRGLSLKKSEFSKVRATIKSKDANQCHYKWGHVRIFLIDKGFHYLSKNYSFVLYTEQLHCGTGSQEVAGTMTTESTHEHWKKKRFSRSF